MFRNVQELCRSVGFLLQDEAVFAQSRKSNTSTRLQHILVMGTMFEEFQRGYVIRRAAFECRSAPKYLNIDGLQKFGMQVPVLWCGNT